MAVPTLNFTLHVAPTDDVAEGEGDMDSLFPHTPRNDASWFEADPPAELIEQCLRPGHCVVPEGEVCEWFHRKLAQLGHAFNEVGNTLMAHTWFECAYAARASSADLISAANMRLKLGQWALVEQLYLQIVRMELTDAQREIVERKLNDVAALKAGSAPMPGASAPGPSVPQDELASLVAAADDAAARVPAPDKERLLQLLRACAFAANAAGDFAAAQNWFDCSFALSHSLTDLLSAANMRSKLSSTSPAAAIMFQHTLAAASATDKEKGVASRKLHALETARAEKEAERRRLASLSGRGGEGDVSFRAYE